MQETLQIVNPAEVARESVFFSWQNWWLEFKPSLPAGALKQLSSGENVISLFPNVPHPIWGSVDLIVWTTTIAGRWDFESFIDVKSKRDPKRPSFLSLRTRPPFLRIKDVFLHPLQPPVGDAYFDYLGIHMGGEKIEQIEGRMLPRQKDSHLLATKFAVYRKEASQLVMSKQFQLRQGQPKPLYTTDSDEIAALLRSSINLQPPPFKILKAA